MPTDGINVYIGQDARLRSVSAADADELFALTDANRQYLRQWLPWLDGTRAPDDTLAFIRGAGRQSAAGQGFVAVLLVDERIAGVIGYHGIDWSIRSGRLGYWLAEARQGRGLMTCACRAMISDAFTRLDLDRLTIACAVGNIRSRAIPERLGFSPERTVLAAERLYDREVDHVVYALERSAWTGARVR